jgi:outer membrane protein assembly factor BamB
MEVSMRTYRSLIWAWLVLGGVAGAGVIHVPGDIPRIQDAMNMANVGDTVIVAEGTYNEFLQFVPKNITVTGTFPDDWGVISRTIVQPPTGYAGPVVQFSGGESPACVLMGLTIQNGKDVGIRGNNAQATISRCWVRNNTSGGASGGIHMAGGLIDRCRVTGNYGTNVGGIGSCNGIISNCLVAENRGINGGLYNCMGAITHCTIVNNRCLETGTAGVNTCSGTITNCIIWGNTALGSGGAATVADVVNSSQPAYSCYSKAILVTGNIRVDPQLGPGYSLLAGSPCIDAGTNTPPIPLSAWDLRGGNRVVDGNGDAAAVTDMGAIEYDPVGVSLSAEPGQLDFGGAGGVAESPVKTVALYNLDGYAGNWQLDTAGAAWLTVEPASGTLSQTAETITVRVNPAGLVQGEYTYNLSVTVEGTVRLVVPVMVHVGNAIRVPQDVAQIQAAIVQAVDWDAIVVSPGTYKENLDFLGKKIVVRSADPQDWNTVQTTIVNGRCAGPCVTFIKGEGRDSIVEGLTLQLGGGLSTSYGPLSGTMGGGILCQDSSPTIRRCNVSWNGYGSYPSPGYWPPDQQNRKVNYGGGIALIGACQARVEDCLLIGNITSSRGIAIYATGDLRGRSEIDRCTITDNILYPTSGSLTGTYDIDCTGTATLIRNTIAWSTRNTRSILVANTNQIQYCTVQNAYQYPGNYGSVVLEDIACTNGNIVADPRFVLPYDSSNPTVYDYRLKADSPCINHGDPGFDGEGQRDPAGNMRVMDGRLDMGAFEFVPEVKIGHPMEGDVWAAGSRHDISWTEYQESVVIVNPGFDWPFSALSSGGTVTTQDVEVPGWTIGPNSGVNMLPGSFDTMPTLRGKITAFDRGSGVYQLLVDSYRPNCRYTLKLFVGSRKDIAAVTNWQAALTAGDRSTIVAAVTQAESGIPGLGKWISASLVLETGAEGVDANVGKRIGILLTGLPRVDFDAVSLEVTELAPTATVDVEFSADNGQNWQTLADDLLDTGSYSWTIPSDAASETCRVRAVSSRPDFVPVPSGLFTIQAYQAGEPVESRWPTEGHDAQRTGLAADNGPELGCVKWQYNAGSPIGSSVAIGPDDRVIVGGSGGKLTVLDSAGQTLWTYTLAGGLSSGISIGADGSVYVGDQKGVLYAVNPAGQLRWKHQTKAMIADAPAVTVDGGVIFGLVDGTIVALGADGSELWSFTVPGPGKVSGAVVASPTIGRDGNVYVGGLYNGKLYALDPADGHVVWTCAFDAGAANQNRSLANAPAVGVDGTIYATLLNDTRLYAVNPSDGTIAWTTNLAGTAGGDYSTDYPTRYKEVYPWATAAVGPDGTIYVAFDDPYLRSVNPNGTIRWARRLGMVGGFGVSVGANGKIYAAGDDRSLYVLDAEGAILSRFDGTNWLSWPVIGADATLYVSDFAGTLWAIAPQPCNGKPQRLGRPADITLDGKVRLEDLAELAKVWKECTDLFAGSPCMTTGSGWKRMSGTTYMGGDIDRDYYVGLSDLLVMAERWMSE